MHLHPQGLKEIAKVSVRQPTLKRSIYTVIISTAYTVVWLLLALFRWLDDVFTPGYRKQEVERPIFVFANPRSGTTLLHRLLELDEGRFTTIKLYQTIFSSVILMRFIATASKFADSWLGAPLRMIFKLFNEPFSSRWQGVHEMGLDKAEEDEAVFVLAQQSPTMGLLYPFMDGLWSQTWLDKIDPDERKRFMDYYEQTLQRYVYVNGGKQLLNKNVFFPTRVRAMYERFPDAVFVYLIRNPYDSLPSFLNMFYRAWQDHTPGLPADSELSKPLIKLGFDYYRHALAARKFIPKEQFIVVRYEDLVADLRGTVHRLYGHLDLELSDEFQARLEEVVKAHEEYESVHQYSLEQFGLTKTEVYKELQDVFEEFGYDAPAEYLEAAE